MKLCYVVGSYGKRYLANEIHRELLLHFARHGHRCLVYAGVTPAELEGEPICYEDGPITVVRQLCVKRGRGRIEDEIGQRLLHYGRFLPLLRGFRSLLREHPDIDVVHADAAYPIGAMAALAMPRHMALVPSIHGGDIISYPGYGYGRFLIARALLRLTWRRSALVRVNSLPMAGRAQELGCPAAKLRPILVNIGSRFFEQPAELVQYRRACREAVAAAHGLDADAPLLIALGRLLPLKGFHDAIAAMPLIHERHPNVQLLIAGPNVVDPLTGDQRVALERAIEASGAGSKIRLLNGLGYETEVGRYLAAADLCLAVAHIEGLNRTVAEAGAVGTPTVVTETTPISTLVEQMGAGVVVPAHNPQALARAINSLIDQPERREQRRGAAQRLAQQFRSEVIAEQLLALYDASRDVSHVSARVD
ncbi:MAG: hypothetical protein NVSMB42_13130 [Herpetosiphon sp.]